MLYALELLKRAGYDSVPSGGVDAVRMLASVLTKMDECADEIAGRLLPYDPEVEESIAGLFEEDALTDATERLFGETAPTYSRMGTHTTSLSACDSSGNLVCLTQTLDHGFGSGVVIPGTGVVMNNGMAWLNTDPDTKRADKLVPYQRYFAPVVPTVALTNSGQPLYAIGTPGGNGIPQTTLQVYANILFHEDDIQSAIDKPRIIVGAVIPEGGRNHKIDLERGFAPEVRQKFQPEDDESYHYYGNFHAVQINPDGSFTAAADPKPRLS
jgi:gamma-glutamyltranspeptidase